MSIDKTQSAKIQSARAQLSNPKGPSPADPVNKRRPGWDEYFLDLAAVIARRSTCRRRNYGAVIVKDNIIISTGYNGAARGEPNCVDTGVCVRQQLNIPAGERYELCVAVHAEQNAIIAGDPVKMQDATIYIAGNEADGSMAASEPCLLCGRMIKNAMIRRAVFRDEKGCKRNVRFGSVE
ncbi:MAG: deaminase [Peptococcaceae bacterium]|nr:deaminase [Peptococcaceae bacterium]